MRLINREGYEKHIQVHSTTQKAHLSHMHSSIGKFMEVTFSSTVQLNKITRSSYSTMVPLGKISERHMLYKNVP